MKVYVHLYNGNVQQNPSCAASCHNESSHLPPVLACDFLSRCKFSTPTSTPLYSSIGRLYAQNPVFEIVREESVKVYLDMYNGNVQQNPLCVESCVTKEFPISPRFSPTVFDPDANSVLLTSTPLYRSRLYAQKTLGSKLFKRKVCTAGMSSRILCAQHPVSLRIFPVLPGSRLRFFIAGQIQHRTVHRCLYTPAQVDAPCRLEADYARNKKLKKRVIFFLVRSAMGEYSVLMFTEYHYYEKEHTAHF